MIKLIKQDFYSLKTYYKTTFFREVFYEANSIKLKVDYSNIKACLRDKGLETFKENVSNNLENQMELITQAINNTEHDHTDERFSNVLQQIGISEDNFFKFLGNYCKNMYLIKGEDKVFKNAVLSFNKMSKISADKNNQEYDINARSDILKQVAIMTRNIRTICSFAYNIFSFILTCNVSANIKNKFASMLSNATCEANLRWPKLCRENVNLLRFENFVPNASRIYDDSQEILRDVDNGTEYIS